MSSLKKIAEWIGGVGVSPGFIAFNAHCWFAAFMVSWLVNAGVNPVIVAIGAALLAWIKEFWYDMRYEPGQTIEDSALDFVGYSAGIIIGMIAGIRA